MTATSDALDLEEGVFTLPSAKAIAVSLMVSAQRSHRRKSDPFRSAMSMLVFYINRGGKNVPPARRRVLERAKDELRVLFGRPTSARSESAPTRRASNAKEATWVRRANVRATPASATRPAAVRSTAPKVRPKARRAPKR